MLTMTMRPISIADTENLLAGVTGRYQDRHAGAATVAGPPESAR